MVFIQQSLPFSEPDIEFLDVLLKMITAGLDPYYEPFGSSSDVLFYVRIFLRTGSLLKSLRVSLCNASTLFHFLTGLQGLDLRKAISEIQFESLQDIKRICFDFNRSTIQQTFRKTTEKIQTVYFAANLYVGK
jgi:hypothetical protein